MKRKRESKWGTAAVNAAFAFFGALFMFLLMITVHLANDPLTADSIRDWIRTEITEDK